MLLEIRKGLKKGQTAMEYALVAGAISLALMVAWTAFGKNIQGLISGYLNTSVSDIIQGKGMNSNP